MIELVTGYHGKDHVTAEQLADFNRGIFGNAAILPVGNKMSVAIQTANQITIKDGVAVIDGRQVEIGYGSIENITIQSGTQGMKRNDIVALEYTRQIDTGVESVAFKTIVGLPHATTPKDPAVSDMDIRTGVASSQKAFCRIRLNGTAIEGVDMLIPVKELSPHAFSNVVNALDSTDETLALSAAQGKKLKELIGGGKSAKLWTGTIGNGQQLTLSDDIDKYSTLTFVFRKDNAKYDNLTFATSVIMNTTSVNTAMHVLFKGDDTSFFIEPGSKRIIHLWAALGITLVEVYGN